MRIGIISGEFPPMPGGVGHFTRILAERLQEQGHDLRVLSRAGCESDKLPVTGLPGWGLKQLASIQAWADEEQLQIINLQYQTAAFDMSPWVHFLPALLDQPLIVTFHDLRHPYLFPKAGRLRDWVLRHLAGSADGVIATNPEDGGKLARLPRRAIIPIGSNILSENAIDDSSEASELNERWRGNLSESGTLLGFFGFAGASKGIDRLLDALAELRAKGRDVQLLFIGGQDNAVAAGADAREKIAERMREHGLEQALRWTGYLPEAEVAACLRAVDIVVLPYLDGASYRRGSLMAAIHCGCATVTTQPKVEHEAFVHAENLWLIERGSTAAIGAAIERLMDNPQTVEQLRSGARKLRQRFDWDKIARDTLAFFEAALQATGREASWETARQAAREAD